MSRLTNKIAVVTGGASGIGLETVRRFVAEGAEVVFCDLAPGEGSNLREKVGDRAARLHHSRRTKDGPNNGHAIAEALGDRAVFLPVDVTTPSSLEAVISHAVSRFSGLDILVNNAGVGGGEINIENCSDEIFDRTIAVNLRAVWHGMKYAFPHLRARGGGSIITTSSVSALLGLPGQGAYGASKAGVLQLTRVAAIEGAPSFIRANAVCPGGILTPIIYDSPFFDQALDRDAVSKALAGAQPLPRAGLPADVANAILWLASDESSFVTGQAIAVDGGLTAEFDARRRPRAI